LNCLPFFNRQFDQTARHFGADDDRIPFDTAIYQTDSLWNAAAREPTGYYDCCDCQRRSGTD